MPQEPDSFSGLRQVWCDSLRSTGLLPQILQRLGSEDKAAPLSDSELQPFLSGLRRWLGVSSEAVWNACLEVSPGQPFRLHLWRILAEISKDPDSKFTDQLVSGVELGVRCSSTVLCNGPWPSSGCRSSASGVLHVCMAVGSAGLGHCGRTLARGTQARMDQRGPWRPTLSSCTVPALRGGKAGLSQGNQQASLTCCR